LIVTEGITDPCCPTVPAGLDTSESTAMPGTQASRSPAKTSGHEARSSRGTRASTKMSWSLRVPRPPRGRMVFDTKHFLYYFRLTSDHRLLFGGRAQFSEVTSASTQRAARILRRAMIDVFPELVSTRIDYAWNGTVAFTRDEMPHTGQLDGAFYAAGYSGHGVAMATALGDLIGRYMAGESVRHPFLEGEFKPIPFNSIMPWLLPAAGAYFRLKDWIS
jgi:glycine/D-amino acid oxidase-like deaminating enzyme